jgi:hypothetical protein
MTDNKKALKLDAKGLFGLARYILEPNMAPDLSSWYCDNLLYLNVFI